MPKILFLVLFSALYGCAQQAPIKANTSVSDAAANYSSYYWERHEQVHFVPELAHEMVLKTNEVLSLKGYRQVEKDKADFSLTFILKPINNDVDVTTQGNFEDYGPGVSCSGGECESTNTMHRITERRVHIHTQAFVQLTATSLKTNQQLWQAESTRELEFDFDPDQISRPESVSREKRNLDRMIAKMLSPIPSIN